MAAEVCTGSGSADVERKANVKEIAKSQSKYYKTYCSPSIKHKFKRLHEARYMLQEFKKERAASKSSLDTDGARKRRSLLGGVAFTCTTGRGYRISSTAGRRRGSEGAKLLQ